MARYDGSANLIPVNQRSKEEARELSRKGGRASGRARRWKGDIAACIREKLGDEATMEEFCRAMLEAVIDEHSVEAAKFCRDTIGQAPVSRTKNEITGADGGALKTEIVMNFVRSKQSDDTKS